MPSISAQQIRHFEDDGFLVLKNVLTNADLQPLISDIESVVEERVAALEQLDGGQRFEAAPFDTRLHEIESRTGKGIAIRKAVTGKHLKSAGLVSLAANERLLDVVEGPHRGGDTVSSAIQHTGKDAPRAPLASPLASGFEFPRP